MARGISLAAMAVMVEGLASTVTATSAPPLPLVDGSRCYTKLLATVDYDVWLIAWAASGALDLHDHGGARGVARVVEGQLVETYTDLIERHPLRSLTIAAGQATAFGATRVHEVWNPGPAVALSVHAYSPPLATMTFYDARPSQFLEPLRCQQSRLVG